MTSSSTTREVALLLANYRFTHPAATQVAQNTLSQALYSHSDFDLTKHGVSRLGQSLTPAVAALATHIQRIAVLAARSGVSQDHTPALTAQFTSAAHIASLASPADLTRAVSSLTPEAAEQLHATARVITARTELLASHVASQRSALQGSSLPLFPDSAANADLQELFGLESGSACSEHCDSVLSPSAYLVDLLQSLPGPAHDAIRARRPDIFRLELTCANTDGEVPLIDLVNEILASWLQYGGNSSQIETFNSKADAEGNLTTVAVEPENVPKLAYDILKTEVWPVAKLPYDRDLDQTRVLLRSMGTTREELLRVFGGLREVTTDASSMIGRQLLTERLGLQEADFFAITGESFIKDADATDRPKTFQNWGYDSESLLQDDFEGLSRLVLDFMPRTSYTYQETEQLVQSRFLNGADMPRCLLESGYTLRFLWSKVIWNKSPSVGMRELMALLGGRSWSSGLGTRIYNALSALPDALTIVLGPEPPSGRLPAQDEPRRFYPLVGWVEWGTSSEALLRTVSDTPRYLNTEGTIYQTPNKDDRSGQPEWFFDKQGAVCLMRPPGTYAPHLYEEAIEVQQGKLLFLRWPERNSPPVARLLADGRTWERLFRPESDTPDFAMWNLGPHHAASVVTGWGWRSPDEDEPDSVQGEADGSSGGSEDGDDQFSATQLTIRTKCGLPLSKDAWARVNAFIRLQKASGWTILELDDVLVSLNGAGKPMTPALLEQFTCAQKLREIAGGAVPLNLLLILWSDLDHQAYDRLFLRLSITKNDPIFALDREEEPGFVQHPAKLVDHLPQIATAFGVLTSELMGIVRVGGLLGADLSMVNISLLLRQLVLLRILGQDPNQLPALLKFFPDGVGSPDGSHPSGGAKSALAMVRFWSDAMTACPAASPSDWDFILTGTSPPAMLSDSEELLPATLALLKKKADSGDKPITMDLWVEDIVQASGSGISTELARIILAGLTLKFPSAADFEIFDGFIIAPKTGEYTLSRTEGSGYNGLFTNHPVQLIGGKFYAIKGSGLKWTTPGAKENIKIPSLNLLPASFVSDFEALTDFLARHQTLFTAMETAKGDIDALLKLVHLSIKISSDRNITFGSIQDLVDIRMAARWVGSVHALNSLLQHAGFSTPDDAAKALSELTNGNKQVLQTVVEFMGPASPASYTFSMPLLCKIREGYGIIEQLGLGGGDASFVFKWAQEMSPSPTTAEQIRRTARGKAGSAAWNTQASALFDPIRRSCRDALVAACLNRLRGGSVRDSDDLLTFFLVDVNVGTCLKTSRIKQALATIQLFYQRCVLGLEPVNVSEFNQTEWNWKKSYDTWQANRRVLLWPENWMDPGLRDVKTPQFRDLEGTLSQGQFNFESALAKYVADTATVADLEPIATYGGASRDFVFARTRQAPHSFYSRSMDLITLCWTPWEKVDVDIPTLQMVRSYKTDTVDLSFMARRAEAIKNKSKSRRDIVQSQLADHPSRAMQSGHLLYPRTLSGNDDRLALFVPVVTERTTTISEDKTDVMAYSWEIGMTVTECRDGKWAQKQTATGGTLLAIRPPLPAEDEIYGESVLSWTDLDENQRRMSLISCRPYTMPDQDIIGIKVYIAQAQSRDFKDGASYGHSRSTVNALFLGEFRYESGHLRLHARRPLKANTDLDSAISAVELFGKQDNDADDWDISFGGVNYYANIANGTRDYENFSRRYISPPSAMFIKPDGRLKPYAIEYKPGTTHQGAVWCRIGTMPVTLRQDASDTFQHQIASADYEGLFDVFNKVDWPNSYFEDQNGNPATSGNETTQLHQALGKPTVSSPSYHELRTPAAIYNWEVCVHVPMLLTQHFLQAQLFDQALKTIRKVVNLTATDHSEIWKFRPFRDEAGRTAPIYDGQAVPPEVAEEADANLAEWNRNPFDPFAVARQRTTAYMRWFAAKFIEILIAKGDSLFRAFTMESINAATQCYVEASILYGPRATPLPKRKKTRGSRATQRRAGTYESLTGDMGAWRAEGHVLTKLETLSFSQGAANATVGGKTTPMTGLFNGAAGNYFCIPPNASLAQQRDLIDDRLRKIRNCQDIDGNPRTLALWEPPMDPGALVRGAAAGALGSMLSGPGVKFPNYRFVPLLRFAQSLCSELKSLSSVIISLRERRDGELASSMRLRQEESLGALILEVRKAALEEARMVRGSLAGSRAAAVSKMKHYLGLLGRSPADYIPEPGAAFKELNVIFPKTVTIGSYPVSPAELAESILSLTGLGISVVVPPMFAAAAIAAVFPESVTVATPLGVGEEIQWGGQEVSNALALGAQAVQAAGELVKQGADNAGKFAALQRQTQERVQAANEAGHDIGLIDAQIEIQDQRIKQVSMDMDLQQAMMENTRQMEAFVRSKYTGEELFSWMIGGLQRLYSQSYELAATAASQTELAYLYERGPQASASLGVGTSFIQTGSYWNSSRDGLLAGEMLSLDLRRLEAARQEARTHDFELTKQVSLRALNPLALAALRRDGKTTAPFTLPEVLFDLDFPGHYQRRIRSVAVSIPCVVGPYTNVNCTLTLVNNRYRVFPATTETATSYGDTTTGDGTTSVIVDARFRSDQPAITTVAASSAQSDPGVFELSFHDERYMPFEGAGVVSNWNLELSSVVPQFSYATISDVILHIRYTARNGVDSLRGPAASAAKTWIKAVQGFSKNDSGTGQGRLCLLADARAEFASAWAGFRATGSLLLGGLDGRLPYFAKGGSASITGVSVCATYGSELSGKTLVVRVEGVNYGKGDGNDAKGTPLPATVPLSAEAPAGGKATVLISNLIDVTDWAVEWSASKPARSWVVSFDSAKGSDASTWAKGLRSLQLFFTYKLDVGQ